MTVCSATTRLMISMRFREFEASVRKALTGSRSYTLMTISVFWRDKVDLCDRVLCDDLRDGMAAWRYVTEVATSRS